MNHLCGIVLLAVLGVSICSSAMRSESEAKAEDNISVSWSSVTYSRTLQNPKTSPSIQIPEASEIVSLDIEVAINPRHRKIPFVLKNIPSPKP